MNLETPRECVDETGEFRNTDNAGVGQVGDMGDAFDARHVMLANGLE